MAAARAMVRDLFEEKDVACHFLIFLFLCCQGFTFPNAPALSLAPFGYNAGSASALPGAIQMGTGACTTAR
jgi:DHA1 family bicyclomycin/chloramphenicol resistance-like MFS transporter